MKINHKFIKYYVVVSLAAILLLIAGMAYNTATLNKINRTVISANKNASDAASSASDASDNSSQAISDISDLGDKVDNVCFALENC